MSTSQHAHDVPLSTIERALESRGTNDSRALYALARQIVQARGVAGVLADVGCGTGRLHHELNGAYQRYIGIDVVRHTDFPVGAEFIAISLDEHIDALPRHVADVVCCIETIEHLENPRALVRQLSYLAKPAGLVVLSTPNQLSLLSKLCLLFRNEFVFFQERPGLYPAHITALLECDLRRLALESGWSDIEVHYSREGRIPGTSRRWPRWLSAVWPRAFSDNVMLRAVTAQSGTVSRS